MTTATGERDITIEYVDGRLTVLKGRITVPSDECPRFVIALQDGATLYIPEISVASLMVGPPR